MAFMINGKGDSYRAVNSNKYDSNYSSIKWKYKKEDVSSAVVNTTPKASTKRTYTYPKKD